ncbi:MAG TPA: serine hydrolase domain-containing protein [Chloroflexia bacterium]|jgi:CubicO group peptidase (beta-lactamase class C family)|nr:serine hydrolase domain-containing protein [Chloroflexia bacterium]
MTREFQLPPTVPGVSLAVTSHGDIEWSRGYGVLEAGGSAPVTPDTLFQACSVSKAVTAIAALRLVQEGALDLDADVNTYLVSWQVPLRGSRQPVVTLRQLLSHTAGLNFPWSAGYHPEQEVPTLLEVLQGEKPSLYPAVEVVSTPGRRFSYSAGGYCVLQQLLIDVLGRPFPELMRELVLAPLDMQQSTYEQPLPQHLRDYAATGHRASGRPVAGKWRVYPEMAAAGLWTTPSDLARLAIDLQRALSGEPDTLLTGHTVRQMLEPQANARDRGGVGLGLFVQRTAEGLKFGHPGDNEGYTARWVSVLDNGLRGRGVVIMTNSDAGWDYQEGVLEAVASEWS